MRATVGDIVKFPNGKIFTIIRIKSGRKYYNLNMVEQKTGNTYKGTVRDLSSLTIIGKAEKEDVQKGATKVNEVQYSRAKRERERNHMNYEAATSLFGDLLYHTHDRYNFPSNLKVVIQFKEGAATRKLEGLTQTGVLIPGRVKAIRYVHAKKLLFEEKECPLNPEQIAEAQSKGILVGISNGEFYIDSIGASKSVVWVIKNHYDCASTEYFFDPVAEVYWRHAGSFD